MKFKNPCPPTHPSSFPTCYKQNPTCYKQMWTHILPAGGNHPLETNHSFSSSPTWFKLSQRFRCSSAACASRLEHGTAGAQCQWGWGSSLWGSGGEGWASGARPCSGCPASGSCSSLPGRRWCGAGSSAGHPGHACHTENGVLTSVTLFSCNGTLVSVTLCSCSNTLVSVTLCSCNDTCCSAAVTLYFLLHCAATVTP